MTVLHSLRKCKHASRSWSASSDCARPLLTAGCSWHTLQLGIKSGFADTLSHYFNCLHRPSWPAGLGRHNLSLIPRTACTSLLGQSINDKALLSMEFPEHKFNHRHRLRRSTSPIHLPSSEQGLTLVPYIVVSVQEDAPIGYLITPLYAKSSSALIFQILSGNGAGSFSVNASGAVILARSLDYEADQQHSIVVSVSQASSTATTPAPLVTVVIEVLDVNEFLPMFIFPGSTRLYQVTLPFTSKKRLAAVQPVFSVRATDGDIFSKLHFAITDGNQLGDFNMSSSGEITTTAAFQGSSACRYELVVTVFDGLINPRTSSAVVQVSLDWLSSLLTILV